MLTTRDEADKRVTTARRTKLAYVYVRQSSAGQVRQHQESTELQYRLVDRAAALGWSRAQIVVIDDDLGKSGRSGAERCGFQRLVADIGLSKVGLVLSLDASRLARSNQDWHQLLELCSIFGVILADTDRLYDPADYHDRLLLGLSGIMSEAELYQIRTRLHRSEQQKAARGELHLPLPAGLVYGPGGEIALNPDEEVQARLRLVFDSFRELQSARSVARRLRRLGLPLPVRPLRGPAPHQVIWVPADSSRVLHVLHSPAYAGAYVYGQHRQDLTRRRPGVPGSATVRVAVEEWPICLRDAHPGYIGWEEFMANQAQLADNVLRPTAAGRGAPRKGRALLQGIVACGRCGRRMSVLYSGRRGEYPVYRCQADQSRAGLPRCQEIRALQVDDEFERILLEALAPDQVALAVAAVGQIAAETQALEHQWALRRERARYEAERAWRQYNAVEPENRLVARSLERVWEEKLRAIEAVDQAYTAWHREQLAPPSNAECAEMLYLAQDLPRVWQTATAEERKRILRLVVHSVTLDQGRDHGLIWMHIVWQTAATSEHQLQRRVQGYARYAATDRLERRLRELTSSGRTDRATAAALNTEGYLTAHGTPFAGGTVYLLRKRWKIPAAKVHGPERNPPRWADGS